MWSARFTFYRSRRHSRGSSRRVSCSSSGRCHRSLSPNGATGIRILNGEDVRESDSNVTEDHLALAQGVAAERFRRAGQAFARRLHDECANWTVERASKSEVHPRPQRNEQQAPQEAAEHESDQRRIWPVFNTIRRAIALHHEFAGREVESPPRAQRITGDGFVPRLRALPTLTVLVSALAERREHAGALTRTRASTIHCSGLR